MQIYRVTRFYPIFLRGKLKKGKDSDMTEVNIRKIRKIYGICMAVYSAIVGILFIIQVWAIYRSTPNDPYTVESISAAFSKIAVPVWIGVAALIAGAFIPSVAAEKTKAYISSQMSDAIVFAVLIIVLLVKPTGLLGKNIQEKV